MQIIDGLAFLNIPLHVHPMYLKPIYLTAINNPGDWILDKPLMSSNLSKKSNSKIPSVLAEYNSVIPITASASWNFAIKLTQKSWNESNRAKRKSAATDDDQFYYDDLSIQVLTQTQINKNNLHDIQHYFNKSNANREIFMTTLQEIKDKEQAAAAAYKQSGTTVAIDITHSQNSASRKRNGDDSSSSKKKSARS